MPCLMFLALTSPIPSMSSNSSGEIMEEISKLSNQELRDLSSIVKLLGYSIESSAEDIEVTPRGYRMLSRIPKTPATVVENMVNTLGNFQQIIRATTEELDDIEGIGEVRAKNIKQGIKRLQEQAIYESRYYR